MNAILRHDFKPDLKTTEAADGIQVVGEMKHLTILGKTGLSFLQF